ncbi:MAG: CRISPR-associated endonuclease Cas2 [Armatimonadota bacterium]|nr:CRISPR-associated endonuclease Cas2 [Armatimonadota bacterium]
MYVILVYDVNEKRVAKACKFCRRYLNWVQNSVFEGELTEARMARMKSGLRVVINEEEDSVLIFKLRDQSLIDKQVMGLERSPTDNVF